MVEKDLNNIKKISKSNNLGVIESLQAISIGHPQQ